MNKIQVRLVKIQESLVNFTILKTLPIFQSLFFPLLYFVGICVSSINVGPTNDKPTLIEETQMLHFPYRFHFLVVRRTNLSGSKLYLPILLLK